MGQVIEFPVSPTPYPDRADDLGFADSVLLFAVRKWVEAYRGGEDPVPRLRAGLATVGAQEAASAIDALMATVARAVRRPVDIHCPACPNVSRDEGHLLHAASLAQAGTGHLAETVLRTTLLSAEGAAFAAGSLQGLGELLTQAWLFLTRRESAIRGPEPDDGQQSRTPPAVH
jgi:hypothetical protein